MGISMGDKLRAHTFVEMCKTEAIGASLKILESINCPMTEAYEEFIVDRVNSCIEQYNLEKTYDLESYIFVGPDQSKEDVVDQADEFFVKASEVSVVFSELQSCLVGMLIDIIIGEFSTYLIVEREGSDGQGD